MQDASSIGCSDSAIYLLSARMFVSLPVFVLFLQEDRKEGMTAFIEKRPPTFQDK